MISNQYYQSVLEKINTIGQILANLQRRTSFTYTEDTKTDRQTDGDVNTIYITKKYIYFITNETHYFYG